MKPRTEEVKETTAAALIQRQYNTSVLIQYTTPLESFTCRSFCVHFHSMPHLLLLIGLTTGRYINPL